MSNECYKASALLIRAFQDDDITMEVIERAEAEENYTALRIGLIHLHAMIEILLVELGKAERRRGLEEENTEYNVGHNVKYYTEE